MRGIVSNLAILFASVGATASAEDIKTHVPQAHFDAFVQECRGRELPSATCQCMALKMIRMGQDGEIALDAMGLQARKLTDPAVRRKEAVALFDRYHITASQAQAAVSKIAAGSTELARSCI